MNTLPAPAEEARPQRSGPDDAFDDPYAWVGYESAQPLSFSGADQEERAGAGEQRAD